MIGTKVFSFFLLLGLLLFLFGAKPSLAQTNPSNILKISPLIFNISLSPGKEYEYEVLVENLTDSPLPVKAYFENFTATDEEGGYSFENRLNPLLSWSSLSKKDMIISAKGSEKLYLRVEIPSKVSLGGYYGVLFFEPLLAQKNGNALVSAKIGALLLANVGVQSNPAAEILSFSTKKVNQTKNLPYLLRIRNNGLNHTSAKPFLTIKPILGREQSLELEEKFIFPGKARRWEETISLSQASWGIYKISTAVSLGDGKQITKSTYFLLAPISKGLLILVTISLCWFMLFKRKRLVKALRILSGKPN